LGVFYPLSLDVVRRFCKVYYDLELKALYPTTKGLSETTYLLECVEGRFILKRFERTQPPEITRLQSLLRALNRGGVPVNQPLKSLRTPLLLGVRSEIFTACEGAHAKHITPMHLRGIGEMLRVLHELPLSLRLPSLHTEFVAYKRRLANTPFEAYEGVFDHFRKEPNEGVIHGDLFCDNLLFDGEVLSGVLDWGDARKGPYGFDLGVVVLGWCFEYDGLGMEKITALLEGYGGGMTEGDLKHYAQYAALYYGMQRYETGRNFPQMLQALDEIEQGAW